MACAACCATGGGVLGAVDVDVNMPVEVVSFDLDDTLWSTK